MTDNILPVILCGGAGTRLWPLSRKSFPKQFVPLIGARSLLELTVERVAGLGGAPVTGQSTNRILTVASEAHRFMVIESLRAAGVSGSVILEPVARNTAPAMALAALHAEQSGFADDLLLFCPADHHIPDSRAFARAVRQGAPAARAGAIVTFGVVPAFPCAAYGYIRRGEARPDAGYRAEQFIEKPDAARAQALLLAGDALWNAGIFLTRADALIEALARYARDILESCRVAMRGAGQEAVAGGHAFIRPHEAPFTACRGQSIDYAVMEPHDDVAVVPFTGQWSDVGSWDAVADLIPADDGGNRIDGHGLAMETTNTFLHAPHRPVVALGVRDLLVIDTPDAVLIAHRERAEQVRDVVARLEDRQYAQATTHRKIARPWGWSDSVDAGDRFQVKRIRVKPGASLSLQKHHHRAEHWIVVKGAAEVTRGGDTFLLSENQSTYIPIGETHRLKNPGKLDLEMIEVQSGGYLGEDDIVRLDDTYGRGDSE